MTTEELLARWERVCVEPYYMVWGPDVNDAQKGWAVVDAECVHICYCDSEEMAQMVADAVYDYDAKMERLRCEHYADKV
jgi:hypothetical protein